MTVSELKARLDTTREANETFRDLAALYSATGDRMNHFLRTRNPHNAEYLSATLDHCDATRRYGMFTVAMVYHAPETLDKAICADLFGRAMATVIHASHAEGIARMLYLEFKDGPQSMHPKMPLDMARTLHSALNIYLENMFEAYADMSKFANLLSAEFGVCDHVIYI